jgi:hypothetical protein
MGLLDDEDSPYLKDHAPPAVATVSSWRTLLKLFVVTFVASFFLFSIASSVREMFYSVEYTPDSDVEHPVATAPPTAKPTTAMATPTQGIIYRKIIKKRPDNRVSDGRGEHIRHNIARLETELESQFENADCRADPYIQFGFNEFDFGMGAELNYIISSFAYLLAHRKGYLVFKDPDSWKYANYRTCARGWQCFFKPLSRCQNASLRMGWQIRLKPKHTMYLNYGVPFRYPTPFRFNVMGPLEFYTYVMKYMWRPQVFQLKFDVYKRVYERRVHMLK